MRNKILSFSLLAIFTLMLWYGSLNFEKSMDALILWFETLVPSLFCIMVIVKVMFAFGALDLLVKPIALVCEPLFHIAKKSVSYVVALLFLGFPAGAAFIDNEVKKGSLTKAEGERLLITCSFATPGFVILTVGTMLFKSTAIGLVMFLIQCCSGLLLLFCTRKQSITAIRQKQHTTSFVHTIGEAMRESGKALYMMGGYLMLCMSLTGILLQFLPPALQFLITVVAEFSNGTIILSSLSLSLRMRLTLVSMLLSFGGFCVHMQVLCMSDHVEMRYGKYLCFRLIQALLSGMLAHLIFR